MKMLRSLKEVVTRALMALKKFIINRLSQFWMSYSQWNIRIPQTQQGPRSVRSHIVVLNLKRLIKTPTKITTKMATTKTIRMGTSKTTRMITNKTTRMGTNKTTRKVTNKTTRKATNKATRMGTNKITRMGTMKTTRTHIILPRDNINSNSNSIIDTRITGETIMITITSIKMSIKRRSLLLSDLSNQKLLRASIPRLHFKPQEPLVRRKKPNSKRISKRRSRVSLTIRSNYLTLIHMKLCSKQPLKKDRNREMLLHLKTKKRW
jgi:hypothetical protein